MFPVRDAPFAGYVIASFEVEFNKDQRSKGEVCKRLLNQAVIVNSADSVSVLFVVRSECLGRSGSRRRRAAGSAQTLQTSPGRQSLPEFSLSLPGGDGFCHFHAATIQEDGGAAEIPEGESAGLPGAGSRYPLPAR
ncbi:hypothetical protein chiPu_0000069 [Chiloscyllium punctatum]|uniref:Uncharacterized protein n=1 Tax=Chiloscyllium punctatum TaxID=137246 RepID=A0A401RN54_CHIPU|nr:hypothetical protein [Chiloscyllium punctatum]